jgi:Flp pilus assembly protein CpaB
MAVRRPVVVPRRGEFVLARLRLRRREVLWWATAIGLAGVTVTVVAGALGRADAAADRWGPARDVLVATGTIEIGEEIEAADITGAAWPGALVPPDAVAGGAEGRVAVAAIRAGEVLVEHRLAPDGLRGAVALLPPDTRALAVPDIAGGLALRPGDRVDVLATADPFALGTPGDGPDSGPTTRVVAAGATVVAVADDSTTVAVPEEQVAEVAAALGQGVVTLALASPLEVTASPSSRTPP